MTRKEKYKKRNHHFSLKFLIGVLLLSGMIVGNIGVAFADQDINSLLTNWFSKKGTESISAIETAIMTEKEAQKVRLKEELQSELDGAEVKLAEFTDEEIKERILTLQEYADQLIEGLSNDINKAEKQRILEDLDKELKKAKEAMENKVKPKGN